MPPSVTVCSPLSAVPVFPISNMLHGSNLNSNSVQKAEVIVKNGQAEDSKVFLPPALAEKAECFYGLILGGELFTPPKLLPPE